MLPNLSRSLSRLARDREIGEVVVLVVVTMPHLEAVNYFFNKTELNLVVHNLLTISLFS